MFTGIVEEIGKIKGIKKGTNSATIIIEGKKVLQDVKLGDSICTNGVCLTVTSHGTDEFSVDVMPETMRRSNLGNLVIGSNVNLERALKASDRLGGHIVSGHIDGTGRIKDYKAEDNAVWISIDTSKEILKYIINKGSIAIDGVSLTVAYVDESIFKVSIIPHTGEETTLLRKKVGDIVNLECDIIGKYVERLISLKESGTNDKSNLNIDYLNRHGFI